jgi:hypothetical protein
MKPVENKGYYRGFHSIMAIDHATESRNKPRIITLVRKRRPTFSNTITQQPPTFIASFPVTGLTSFIMIQSNPSVVITNVPILKP